MLNPDELTLRPGTIHDVAALQQQWIDAQWVTPDDTIVQTEVESFETWVAELDGEVVAGVVAVPFRQVIGGTEFAMAGIRGVTCAIHRRRLGIVDRLFRHALHELRPRYPLSTLFPFSPPFYEKYDYGTCGQIVRWRLLLEDLDLQVPERRPSRLERRDIPALMKLVERELDAIGNGAVHPDEYFIGKQYFPREEKDTFPVTLGWKDEHGDLLAALCWRPLQGGGTWDKNRLFVRRVHGVDEVWRRQALGFVRTFSDQFVELVIDRPAADLFYHHIRKPYHWDSVVLRETFREPGATYETDWQTRLLDPAAALSRPRRLHGPGGTVLVELRDSVFQDLNGCFSWNISSTEPGWRRWSGGDEPAGSSPPRLAISMGDLSRLWYGAVDVYQLLRAGRVECDEPAAEILHAALGGFRCHIQVGF